MAKSKKKLSMNDRLAKVEAEVKRLKEQCLFNHPLGEACERQPAIYCEHANEVPCPCPNNCYCKSYTCRSK